MHVWIACMISLLHSQKQPWVWEREVRIMDALYTCIAVISGHANYPLSNYPLSNYPLSNYPIIQLSIVGAPVIVDSLHAYNYAMRSHEGKGYCTSVGMHVIVIL